MLLALLAGILSTLSPCVLPLLPVVLASAAAEHRMAPLALAAGVALSFTGIGIFVATVGFAIGLDMNVFRTIAAVLLIGVGVVLLVPAFQTRFATAAGPVSNWTEQRFGKFSTSGIGGQFGVGLLLAAVWTPCVGPTLGAASLMAARGQNLGQVSLTMLLFGIGTALPLLLLGTLSRQVLMRWRWSIGQAASALKMALGVLMIFAGLITLSGLDRVIQTTLTEMAPDWLVSLTTSV